MVPFICTISSNLSQDVFPRFDTPKLLKAEWENLDDEVRDKLNPFNYHLGKVTDSRDIAKLGDQIGWTIGNFLKDKPEIFEKHEIKTNAKFVKYNSKTMQQLKKPQM